MQSTDLGVVLAGGAVGALVTVVVAQVARVALAWSEVALHDEQADEANQKLAIWVDDETEKLVREIRDVGDIHNLRRGVARDRQAGDVAFRKTGALHRYRDERSRVELYLADLRAQERVYHRVIRFVRGRRAGLALTADERVQPFLDRWRAPVEISGVKADVFDRTKRTIEDALAELPNLNLG